MNYFDLHCDTAYEMYTQKQPLDKNTLAVDLDGFDAYDRKAQIFAVWSENTKSAGNVYGDFFAILDYLKEQIAQNDDRAVLCTEREILTADDRRLKIIPAVEGSRLIENDLARLDILREHGVRVLTLAWGGECAVCGAYDTDVGLTDFGYEVVERCEALGILLDVSHLSEKRLLGFGKCGKKAVYRVPFQRADHLQPCAEFIRHAASHHHFTRRHCRCESGRQAPIAHL